MGRNGYDITADPTEASKEFRQLHDRKCAEMARARLEELEQYSRKAFERDQEKKRLERQAINRVALDKAQKDAEKSAKDSQMKDRQAAEALLIMQGDDYLKKAGNSNPNDKVNANEHDNGEGSEEDIFKYINF